MAGGKPTDLDGYRLIVKPLSRWRRFTRGFWPYWQAQEPKFLLEVTRTGLPAQSATLTWHIRFANGIVAPTQVILKPLQTGETTTLEIGGRFLGYTGDTLLTVPEKLSSSDLEHFHTLYTFNTTPKVWISLVIVAGLLAGLFASLLQHVFGL